MIFENGYLRIEFIVISLFLGIMLTDSIYTNFVIYRTCYVVLGYNQSECALLGGQTKDNQTQSLEELVEPYANVITMTRSMTENCITAILCIFIGPWSDRFGRKPLIIAPTIGYTISFICAVIFTLLPNLSPWYFILSNIPICLTGGMPIFITGVLSHVTDITSAENRGMRMGIVEATLGIGIFLGNLCSSYIFFAIGYAGVFGIAAGISFFTFLLVWFFIPETLESNENEGYFKGFFDLSNIKEMLKSTFKERESYTRPIILLSILLLTLYIFVINGDASITFLYLRDKMQWSLKQYTIFSSIGTVIFIVGTVFGIYILHTLLNITESVLVLCGFLSFMNGHLIQGLATKDWHIYGASFAKILGGLVSPMMRSLISKIIPLEEVGKIFAMVVTAESLCGILGSPIYTGIYNKTIHKDPATYCFFTAGIYGVDSVLIIVIIILQFMRRRTSYNSLINENTDDNEVIIT
ncbi:unnamed protein product [Brassicogethes aeneus]|uniref:Major facilitator superfamily (MFS) profile domain-containing protein n=1 Tax=Brassicogethes aeneus TaxID=1431903 RepID=A0A9P0FFB0_BRAAE|nr:unnamed protein product [Brassicogethes aeneus]